MLNWFHWVSSGPAEPDFHGHYGMLYGPKTSWTRTRKDVRIETHALKRNDFAGWLTANGAVPGNNSWMNCWEAVLFSAFRANLIDKIRLRTIHNKAALAYQLCHRHGRETLTNAGSHYSLALSQAFNYFASVLFEPRAGLIPQVGDILFWARDEHVAVSLGRYWENGVPKDRVMSL
jgi:hypothetical protein